MKRTSFCHNTTEHACSPKLNRNEPNRARLSTSFNHNFVRLKNFFLILGMAALISSCKKDDDGTVQCHLSGYVMDAETNASIDSAKVEILSGNKSVSTSTDTTGYYDLGNVSIGDYVLVFSKTGYSTTSKELDLTSEINPGNYDYQVNQMDIIKLCPLKENLVLTVYRKYSDGETLAAASFPYTITTGDFNPPITGSTDANGIINLKNLPQEVNVIIDYTTNGIRYKTNTSVDTRNDNSLIVYGYSPQANLGLAATNILDIHGKPVTDFDVKSNITLQFTVPADTVRSTYEFLQDGWMSVNFTHKWSNNNMKLELDPVNNLTSKTMYSIGLDIVNDTQVQTYSNTLSFETK